jgi:hypothetical protein
MITKFDSSYYGTVDMENLGYAGTPRLLGLTPGRRPRRVILPHRWLLSRWSSSVEYN